MTQILPSKNPSSSVGGTSANWPFDIQSQAYTLQTFLYFYHFVLMFPCRLFVQGTLWSFAKYSHPGLSSQHQIHYDPSVLKFCLFVSVHRQTEKLAFIIECDEFYKLHFCQPPVKQDDTWQPLIACRRGGRAGLLIWPHFLHPNPAHNVVVDQIQNMSYAW